MKKLLQILSLVALLCVPWVTQAQNTLTVADGTSTNRYVPFYGYYADEDQQNQMIYPATDLTAMVGKQITEMVFYYDLNDVYGGNAVGDWTVSLGETTATTLSGLDNSTTLTEVFSGGLDALFSSTDGTLTITFDNGYTYNGGNLLVEFSHEADDYYDYYFYGVTATGASYCYGSQRNFLPKVTFTYEVPASCAKPTGLAAALTEGNGTVATLSWTAGGNETAWQICLNDNENNLIDVTSTTHNLTGLTPEQAYTAKVRANCGTEMSAWTANITFTPTESMRIGSGTATNNYIPASNYYNYSLTEQIYTAAELGAAGNILSIDFYKNSATSMTSDLDIYMVSTTKSSFSGTSDWITVTADDLVYSGSVTFVNNGWTTIELDNPFVYDGTSNVAIVVDNNTNGYVSSTPFLVFTADATQAIYQYNDYTNLDPTAASIGTANGTTTSKNQIRVLKGQPPTCPKPTALTVSNLTGTSATLSWTAGGTETSWKVYLNGSQTPLATVNTPTYTYQNLTGQTAYTFGVVAVCSADDESNVATTNATTLCEAFDIPYTYGFESAADLDCWTVVCTSDEGCGIPTDEEVFEGFARTGVGSFMFSYTTEPPQYLISPELSGIENGLHVQFYYRQYDAGRDTFQVGYSTTDNNVASFIWGDSIHAATSFQRFSANYPANTKYVAIRHTSYDQYYLFIDDITFEESASCLEPTNLAVSNVTTTGATLSWTAGGEETAWDIYVTTDNLVEPNDDTQPTVSGTTTNPTALSNLTPGTIYYVYMRAVCNGQELSEWSAPVSFNTACVAMALPYTYGFEDAALPVCWNVINTNTSYNVIFSNTYLPHNGDRALYIYRASTGDMYTVLPEVDAQYPLNEYQITFWGRYYSDNGNVNPITIGIMTDPDDASTFVPIGDAITLTTTYTQYNVRFNSYTGNGRYIAIQNGSNYTGPINYIDDIEVTALPACWEVDNLAFSNVGRTSFTATWAPRDGETNTFQVIALPTEADEPVALDPEDFEDDAIDVTGTTYTFENLMRETTYMVYVRANCGNNGYGEWTIGNVTTEGLSSCDAVVIGDETSTGTSYYYPTNTYYKNSLSETIIDAAELDGAKTFSKIKFHYAYATATTKLTDVTIWIQPTTKTTFESNTDIEALSNSAVQVYSGDLNCHQGWNEFTFSTNYEYNGEGNLMIIVDKTATEYDGTAYKFTTSECSGNKTLTLYSDSGDPDPTSTTFSGSKSVYTSRVVMGLGYCVETEACPAVTNITVSDITTNSAVVTWTPSTGDYVQGYWVDTTSLWDPENDWREWPSDYAVYVEGANTYTLTGLDTYVGYYVVITPDCNDDGAGTPEASYFHTASVCRTPENISGTITGKHTATITWEAGSTTQTQSYQYFVEYGQTGGAWYYNNGGEPDVINNLGSATSVNLTDVPSNTWIFFYLRNNCGQDGYSPWVLYEELKSYPELPAVVNLEAVDSTHSAVTVRWSHNLAQFADETAWEVTYCLADCTTSVSRVVVDTFCTIISLMPETMYYVEVRPKDGNNYGDATRIYVHTLPAPSACEIVADGTSTFDGAPVYCNWSERSQRTQSIYPASMLTNLVGKQITGVKYFTTISSTPNWTTGTWNLGLAITDNVDLSAGWDESDTTLVYTGGWTYNSTDKSVSLTFDRPFTYTGGNLLVQFVQTSANAYTSGSFYGVSATSGSGYCYGSSATADPMTGNKTNVNYLPKVQFCYERDDCWDVSDITISNVTTNGASISWMPGNQETDWEYMLAENELTESQLAEGYGIWTMNLSLDTNTLQADHDYWFYIRPYCYDYQTYGNWTVRTFQTLATCGLPTLLPATNVSFESVTLNAQANETIGAAATFNFRFWQEGSTVKIDATPQTNGSVDITGLTPSTTYYYDVQVSCTGNDGDSRWTEPMSFTTKCAPVTQFPWSEDFEDYASGNFSDNCWENVHISGNGTNIFSVNTSSMGNNSTHQLKLPDQTAGTLTKLVLPLMTIPDNNYLFALDVYRSNSTYNDNYASEGIRVYLSTDGNIEGATELAFIPRQYTVSNSVIPQEEAVGWYTYKLPLGNNVAGNYCIILRGENQYCTTTYMDNFVVRQIEQYTVTTNVIPANSGIDAPTGGGQYNENTTITLTAAEAPAGTEFAGWSLGESDEIVSTDNPYVFTLNEDVVVNAVYNILTYTVWAHNSYGGTATVNGESSATVTYNTEVTFSAEADACYQFVNWVDEQGNVLGTTPELTVNITTEDIYVEASFMPDTIRTTDEKTICASELPYIWNGVTFTEAGTQNDTLTSVEECDSIATMTLTVNALQTVALDAVTACDSYQWNGQTYNESGTLSTTTEDVNGCDSTTTLALTINNSTEGDTTATACDYFDWYDNRYTMTPVTDQPNHTFRGGNAAGCDSTVYLNLTILRSNTGDTTAVACNSFTWYGQAYNQTSEPTHVFTNVDGCDSTVTLFLTINDSKIVVLPAMTVCDVYEWNGETYEESGSLSYTTEGSNGCDSTTTLALTVNHSQNVALSALTVCDVYEWNGETYEESANLSYTTEDVNGCDSTTTLALTVNHSQTIELDAVTACDSYQWNGQTYNESGNLSYTTEGGNGCDSTTTLALTVNYSTTGDTTAVACNNFTWYGVAYAESTVATHVLVNAAGCDSTVTLHLTINNNQTVALPALTVCDVYEWNGETYEESANLSYTTEDVNGCDSTTTLALTVNHSQTIELDAETACDSYQWNGQTYNESGNLSFTTEGSNGCDSTTTLALTVNYSTTGDTTAVACNNFTWYGVAYAESTVATHVLVNAAGCDSTVTLHLTINNNQTVALPALTVCDVYEWNGETYEESANLSYTTEDVNGCDSTTTLALTVNHSQTVALPAVTACDSYQWNGQTYDESGELSYSTNGANGCDSTTTLALTVNYHSENTVVENIVENDLPYTFAGQTFTQGVTATDIVLQGANAVGCDSIIHFTLNVQWNSSNTADSTICASELPFVWNGVTFTMAGTQSATLPSSTGADSTVVMTLNVNPLTGSDTAATACNNYTWYGVAYSESTVATHVYQHPVTGCDSTVTLTLTINNNQTVALDAVTACDSYQWNGQTYEQSANLSYTTEDVNGCDSTTTLVLTVNYSTENTVAETIVENQLPYTFAGQTFTQGVTATDIVLQGANAAGCDSVIHYTLTVQYNTSNTVDSTICASELPMTWNGVTFTMAGTQSATLPSSTGADSVVVMTLNVNPLTGSDTVVAVCEVFEWNGETYDSTGVYTYNDYNIYGCDSVATLNLTVNYSTESADTMTVCDSYEWHGVVYTESAELEFDTVNAAGCAHHETLSLTVNNSVVDSISVVACDGYEWMGDTITETGVYYLEGETETGCNLMHILNLTVNNSTVDSNTIAVCDSYEWHGQTYYETSIYTFDTVNADGCTQHSILNLTVNYSTVDSIAYMACDSYEWHGQTYYESGIYTFDTVNADGCTQHSILNLTVNNSSNTVIDTTVCDIFTLNDVVYDSTGVYTIANESSTGCANTITLNLTVNHSTESNDTVTACDSYEWYGQTYNETGTYTFDTVNADGCAQHSILNLTVNNSAIVSDTMVVCDSYEWMGDTLTETGLYTNEGETQAGCELTYELNLTVNYSVNVELSDSATGSYVWNDSVYTESGVYTQVFTNASGCDSTVTLTLTIITETPVDSVATMPYFCDFEQEGNNGWVFVDSAQVNYWMIGSGATANSGNAMFITNDGIANAYTVTTPAYSFATRKVRISEAGSYTYSFDWIANGESSYDFLRAALVPDSVEFIPGEYNGFNNTTAVPAGAIALDGGRLNLASTWQTRSGEIVVTDTGLYNIVFMWRNDNSTGTQPPAAIDNVSFTMTACPMVQNVVADPTANSIALSWTAGGSETSWEVTCGGVSQVVNTNAYTFSGLEADTDYVVSVRAICGADDSSLIYTETVHTPCAAVSIPYSENFDSITNSTTAATGVYVPCWNYIMTGTSTYQGANYQPKVYYSATNANSGSYSLRLYGVSYTMLPPMAEPLSGLQLTFNAYTTGASYKLAVGVMEGNTFVPVDTLTTPSSQHTPCTVYFGNYTGNSRIIAFRNFNTSATTYYTYMYIDDVTVDYLPSCVSVTNLTATATAHSVELSWADYLNSSATYTVSDAAGVLATGLTATTYTVTGLNANTDYTFSVTANCSADASGDAVSVTVHTDCDVEALPFMEDFSASLANDACWRGNSSLTAAEVFSGTPLVLGTNNAWTYASSTSNGLEAGHYRVNIYSTSCKKWMVTPAIDLTGVTTAQLTFDVAFTAYSGTSAATGYENNSSQAFMVVVSTDGGQTWLESNATKWQNEGGNYTLASIAGTDYVNQVINLNQYIGDTVKIAFYAQSTVTGGDNNLHLDNIIVSEVPSCPNVMGLTLDSQDSASANISWNSNGADSYEVQVVRNNNVDTTVNVVVLDTTAYISGLMVDNDYQVSVRAICGANAGLWTNPLNIHIGYCVPNPTSIDGQGITAVAFGGMTNSTTHPTAAPYYGNYANMSGSVAAGLDATVEITYATGWTYGTVIWVDWDHSMSFDADELVYTGESLSTNPTTLIATFNIPATTATGSYRMRIAGADSHFDSGTPDPCFTSSYAVAEDYTLIVTEAPACLPVSNLTASNVTANGATLTWSGNADSYYVYNVADATAGQTVTDTTVVLTGLNANTEYTYAVVSGCDTSNVATVTFATLCNAVAIPFTETFEENSATIACWSNEGSGSWTYGVGDYQTATGAYEGARNARMTHTNDGNVTRLVSPVLDFGQAEGAKMTYAHIQRSWTGDQDQLAVLYRTSSNGEWIELANYTSEIATWTVDSVMLPATAFQVAFQMTDGYGYGVAIDSIVFSMPDTTTVEQPDSVLVVVSPAMPAHGTTSMNGISGMASGVFHVGDSVVATATPDSGYLFDYWSVAYLTSGTELTTVYDTVYTNPFVLNIDSNNVTNTMITLLANFQAENGTLDSLTIVLSTADATMGTTNPAPGTYRLGEGDSLMFVPVAYDGYHFTHWSYEIVGITQTPYISTDDTVLRVAQTWLLDNTINYVAYFAPDSVGPDTTWYTVNVVYDTLMGTVTGAGLYAEGDTATLEATAYDGYIFADWRTSTGAVASTESTYSFAVISDVTLMARFIADTTGNEPDSVTFVLTVNDATMGTTTPEPGTYTYAVGYSASVSAYANDGYHFEYWLVSVMGITDTLYAPVYAAVLPDVLAGLTINVQAVFAQDTVVWYTVIGESNDTTMGIVLGSGPYAEGSIATLTAQAKPGFRFVEWSTGETTATIQFTVTEDVTVTATFAPIDGIDDVDMAEVDIYAVGRDIFVAGANGRDIYVFDVNGRLMVSQKAAGETAAFRMRDTGVYLVKVGNAPAKRVMVVR